MARKAVKNIKSKGERLGWTPLDQVKPVSLHVIVAKGERMIRDSQQNTPTTYLIP